MDEEVEQLLLNETDADYGEPVDIRSVTHTTFLLIFCCEGIACDVIIVYTIFSNKAMRTVKNMVLANWAINDILFVICIPIGINVIDELDIIGFYPWCFADGSLIFLFNCMILMWINLFGFIKETQMLAYKIVITVVYAYAGVNMVVGTIFCHGILWVITGFGILIGFSCLLLCLIIKEIVACIRKRNQQDDPDYQFRWMVSRIYVYNMTFIFLMHVLYYITSRRYDIIPHMLTTTMYLGSLYVLIYAVRVDVNYKICVYNLLRRDTSNYSHNNSVNFTRFVDSDVKNEIGPEVSIHT